MQESPLIKDMAVLSTAVLLDSDDVLHLRIKARPAVWHQDECPHCNRRHLPKYDKAARNPKVWKAMDFGGVIAEIEAETDRAVCPEHGVVTAAVPGAYPSSSFTRQSDMTVAWLAEHLSRSAVAEFMRIDWQTVGNCVSRALQDLEPERSRRLNGQATAGSLHSWNSIGRSSVTKNTY